MNLLHGMDEPNRDPSEALATLNCVPRKGTGIESRKGLHFNVPSVGGYGTFIYLKPNTDGTRTEELLTLDSSLYRIKKGTFTIAYSGASAQCVCTHYVSANKMFFKILEAQTQVLNYDEGVGYDDTTVKTLADLKTAIEAVAGFTVTNSGSTTLPAAFLPKFRNKYITVTNSLILTYYYSEKVNESTTDPFLAYLNKRDNDTFLPADAVNASNCLYIATGAKLYKYDGQTVYKAGLPNPVNPTLISYVNSGNLTGTYKYSTSFVFTDNQGNVIESKTTSDLTASPSGQNVNIQVYNVDQNTGYNTNAAVAVGTQTAAPASSLVTLNVDNGYGSPHTLKANDTAYIFNRNASVNKYKTYIVSSATNLTVVLKSTDTIDVTDGDVISNNLRIAIYRTPAGGALKQLVAEIPNNPFDSAQIYTDSTTDANLGAELVTPLKTPGPPPDCTFVQVYKQILVLGHGNKIYYADFTNTDRSNEVFPPTDNAEEIYTQRGEAISGMGLSGDALCVFTPHSIRGVAGDLATDNYQIFSISDHIGCVSHKSIVPLGNGTLFLAEDGIYNLATAALLNVNQLGIPQPESRKISPIFKLDKTSQFSNWKFSRTIGVNDPLNHRIMFFVPSERNEVHVYADRHSRVIVYDYSKSSWWLWDSVNFASGAVLYENELWFQERSKTLDLNYKMFRMSADDFPDDYWDHTTAFYPDYVTGWDSLQASSVYKKPLWYKLYLVPESESDTEKTFTVKVDTEADYIPGNQISSSSVTLAGVQRKWGFPWGQEFGAHNEVELKDKIRGRKSHSVRLRFRGTTSGAKFFISRWDILFATPYGMAVKE